MLRAKFVSVRLRRLAAAARWACRTEDDPRLTKSAELGEWLQEEENRRAFERVGEAWKLIDDHKTSPELMGLRRAALARMERRASRPVPHFAWLAAIAVSLSMAALALEYFPARQMPLAYTTGVGERRVVVLNDKSRIWLDASSAVTVGHYAGRSRQLSLSKGRARFDVAPDRSRPFSVTSGPTTTVAVGTSFDVERLKGKILVTVRKGHVLVSEKTTGRDPRPPVALAPSQELVAMQNGRTMVRSVNIKVKDAWQQGKIVFDDQPLGEAVERFNRYLPRPLMVDPAVADLRISGVFNGGDTHAFIHALGEYFPVQTQQDADGRILLVEAEQSKQSDQRR